MDNYLQNIQDFGAFMQQSGLNYAQAREMMSQHVGRPLTDIEFDTAIKDGGWQVLAQGEQQSDPAGDFREVTGGLLDLSGVMQPGGEIPPQPMPTPRGTGQFEDPNMMDPAVMQQMQQAQAQAQPMPNITGGAPQ